MNTSKTMLGASALLLALTACSKTSGWEVSGDIYGAENSKIALEGFNNNAWYVVDSIQIDGNGTFAYRSLQAAHYPEIMRLSLNGRSIYFPVDSVDRISITTSAADFGTKYDLEGTTDAVSVRQLDSIINSAIAATNPEVARNDAALKRTLLSKALEAPSVIPAYYLINKAIGGKPLFDLSNNADVRLYGAVAQRFVTERPDDPRAEYLKQTFLNAQRALRPTSVSEISLPETGLFDITRFDDKGTRQSLADMASKGGVTILSFTSYGLETSPAYNVILNTVWEKHRAAGLNIYQIAFDADETAWRQTARNLPWTTVWNSTTDDTDPLARYNVGSLPTTFIIDRTGSLAARVTDPTRLEAEVTRYM